VKIAAMNTAQRSSSGSGVNKMSVADTILSVLWSLGESSHRIIARHPYARVFIGQRHRNSYQTAFSRLKNKKLIQKKGREIYALTSEGRKKALFSFINAETNIYKQKHEQWDGGWRMIFFDIPETKRKYRDYLRIIIKAIGFREFQKSVWVYPYQVPSFLKDLLFEENIKQHTRFITTEAIEYDKDLRKLFNLKELP
jgi:DNA-binding transcriptional regulator PaaX